MGYTHYWEFKKNPKNIENGASKFKDAVDLFKKCLAAVPETIDVPDYGKVHLQLAGSSGTGEPKFTDSILLFNGLDDGENDLSHETCYIALDDPDGYEFNFCKTARKPYGVAVCLALLCFARMFGDDFKYSSDGDDTDFDWKIAKDIVKTFS